MGLAWAWGGDEEGEESINPKSQPRTPHRKPKL